MQDSLYEKEESKVVKTDVDAKDGQNKCPKCGATDISLNVKKGLLRCNYCRYQFEAERVVGLVTDITQLKGEVIGSGTQDIIPDVEDVLTFKCSSCGKIDKGAVEMSEGTYKSIIYAIKADIKKLYSIMVPENVIKELEIISKIYLEEKLEKKY